MSIVLFYIISAFILGSVIGSFLNVCIYRIPEEKSIVSPPSSCPNCKAHIAWYDNIPFFSFIILGRKCRSCGAPISWRYPLVEGLSGALCALLIFLYGLTPQFFLYYLLSASLIVITFIDLRYKIIPNGITLPGIVIGFLSSFINPDLAWWDSLLGIIAGGGFLGLVALGYYFLTKIEGMGIGDIKLISMIGAFLGVEGVVFTIVSGSVFGSIIGLFILARGKGDRKMEIPFGPFLSIGAVLYILVGSYFFRFYLGFLY
jgi:leader peptidase (prepilin peptidase)/N-methyltransferase